MRRPVPKMVLVAALLLPLAACQEPDVGQQCTIAWGTGSEDPPDPVTLHETGGSDYFESGNVSCENLVCIVSPARAGTTYARPAGVGYCSKPCVSNDDCFQPETELVCRQMVLDAGFIELLQRTNPALLERYLGEVQFSSYCAVP
jgi:hypothetical protein